MAFGFPAYHAETLTYPYGSRQSDASLRDTVALTIQNLGWQVQPGPGNVIIATAGMNVWSWGETIEIHVEKESLTVTSRCSLPTQCFDWGKNRTNVREFAAELGRLAGMHV